MSRLMLEWVNRNARWQTCVYEIGSYGILFLFSTFSESLAKCLSDLLVLVAGFRG